MFGLICYTCVYVHSCVLAVNVIIVIMLCMLQAVCHVPDGGVC